MKFRPKIGGNHRLPFTHLGEFGLAYLVLQAGSRAGKAAIIAAGGEQFVLFGYWVYGIRWENQY
jgi:hypothetical protein